MSKTKNVGQVSGLFIGTSAPRNTAIIWYDNTPNQNCHKVFDSGTNSWRALNPEIVATTTYSELVNNAGRNGLPIGKFYQIRDKSNVLAIAVSSTKVQYVDTLGNILIDDLGSNIQYHVSSGNLLFDGINGIFNTTTNKLVFEFSENSVTDTENFYLFGKIKIGTNWVLSKLKLKNLISAGEGNSISWNSGLFFNFKSAIQSILNKAGGIVGKDAYDEKVRLLERSIDEVSKNNQEIVSNANDSISSNTTDAKIFSKKLPNAIDTTVTPGDILKNDTLFSIVSKIQRWINKFKYTTGISVSRNFKDATQFLNINNNDTVDSALGKIQYVTKRISTVGVLPDGWSTMVGLNVEFIQDPIMNQIHPDFQWWVDKNTSEAQPASAPIITPTLLRQNVYEQKGFPQAGDSIALAIAKLTAFSEDLTNYSALPESWTTDSSSEDYEDVFDEKGFPEVDDSIALAIAKITAFIKNPTKYAKLPDGWSTIIGSSSSDDIYAQDGFPKPGDSIFYAFAKLTAFLQKSTYYSKLSADWQPTTSVNGEVAYPSPLDTIDTAFAKVVGKLKQLGEITDLKINSGYKANDNDKDTAIIDLKNGFIQFNAGTLTGDPIVPVPSPNYSQFTRNNIQLMANGYGFSVRPTVFSFNSGDSYGSYDSTIDGYTGAIFKSSTYTSGNSAALAAVASGTGKNTFDAIFRRLKVGSITMYKELVSSSLFYITRNASFAVYNGTTEGTIYLPNNPDDGTMVWIARAGNAGLNIHTQGYDRIDTIGESAATVSMSERGSCLLFVYISNISYNTDPAGTTGLWQVYKLDNQF